MFDCFKYYKKRLKSFSISELNSLKSLKKEKSRVWVVVKDPSEVEIELIKKKFNLHPTTAEDIGSINTRIKYEELDNYTFLVFKGVKTLIRKKAEFYTIYFIDGEQFLITIYRGDNSTIETLLKNQKRIETLLSKGEDYLVHHIFDREVDKYVDTREKLSEDLNSLEQIMEHPGKDFLKRLTKHELLIMDIKQRADSITDVCSRLRKPTDNFIQNSLLPYFRDIYDHSMRVSEALKSYLDRIDSIRNSHLSFVSNKMNETMRILTILMALMLPMTIITGFYGMNIALPIQDDPKAYIILIILMAAIMLFMFWVFKKMKWVRSEN
jgi:magnesium transporter